MTYFDDVNNFGLTKEEIALHETFQKAFPLARYARSRDSYQWADGIRWYGWKLGYQLGVKSQAERIACLEKENGELIKEIALLRTACKLSRRKRNFLWEIHFLRPVRPPL